MKVRPFYVAVDGITIKVLGVSFNIRAYGKGYTLTPGKQLKRGKTLGGVGIRTVDPTEIIAWTKGYYVFKKSRLQEVVSTLQNWMESPS